MDTSTGKAIPGFDRNNPSIPIKGTDMPIRFDKGRAVFPAKSYAEFVEIPPRNNFMLIGHIWWAILFGYVGGHVARFLYVRRNGEAVTLHGGNGTSQP
jgi:hypothetical protein